MKADVQAGDMVRVVDHVLRGGDLFGKVLRVASVGDPYGSVVLETPWGLAGVPADSVQEASNPTPAAAGWPELPPLVVEMVRLLPAPGHEPPGFLDEWLEAFRHALTVAYWPADGAGQ